MTSAVPKMNMLNFAIDGDDSLAGVPLTSLFTASVRATEYSKPEGQRHFDDPYAAKLAQPITGLLAKMAEQMEQDESLSAEVMAFYKYIIDRTVYFDKAIQDYLIQYPNCKQIVIFGSGMDTRAYRMNLSADMTVFEIDYAVIHDYKTKVLKDVNPNCQHILIRADVAKDDWSSLLTSAQNEKLGEGSSPVFDTTQSTLWLAEGLMMYIPEATVPVFISVMDQLSAKGSAFVFDGIVSREYYSDLFARTSVNFLVSLASDTLEPLHKLGWQMHNNFRFPGREEEFYIMSKQ